MTAIGGRCNYVKSSVEADSFGSDSAKSEEPTPSCAHHAAVESDTQKTTGEELSYSDVGFNDWMFARGRACHENLLSSSK